MPVRGGGRLWAEGLTRLVSVPVGVHDFIPTEPAEGAGAVEILQGRPEVLSLPVVDEAADEGLLEPLEDRLVTQGTHHPTPGALARPFASQAWVMSLASNFLRRVGPRLG